MSEANNGIVLKKRHIVIAVILILLLLLGGIVLGILFGGGFGNAQQEALTSEVTSLTESSVSGNLDIDPDAGEWTGSKPKDTDTSSTGIKIPGYPSITLPADQKEVTVALLNPEGNPCYFTFELVLKDTNETLYRSKLVPPGKAVTNITLSKALKKGEYNAVIKISTTSLEDQSAMNGANVETVLVVQ